MVYAGIRRISHLFSLVGTSCLLVACGGGVSMESGETQPPMSRQSGDAKVIPLHALEAAPRKGAAVPWITYEAENASGSGTVISTNQHGWEASGGKSVILDAAGEYIEFKSAAEANRLVLRYSVPDGASGTISLYVNGTHRADIPVSAVRLYEPKYDGTKTVRFYDEVDIGTSILAGDTIRIQKDADDLIAAYHIDLVDLEAAPEPGAIPDGFISITSCGAVPDDSLDDLNAINTCFATARTRGMAGVWFPKGVFNQSDRIRIPDGLSAKGAGIWHTRLVGPKPADTDTNGRIGFIMGNNTKVSDMRLTSGIDARRFTRMAVAALKDVERYTIENMWIEYANGGVWTHARHGTIRNNRVRLTYADAIHVDHSGQDVVIENNHVRGGGDDGIAVVSAVADPNNPQNSTPAMNITVRNNTSVANYWGRGMAVVGGSYIEFTDNLVQDTIWAGMYIATEGAYPTQSVDDVLFERNTVIRSGSIPYFGGRHGGIGVSVRRSGTKGTGIRILNNTVRDARVYGVSLDNTQYVQATVMYND